MAPIVLHAGASVAIDDALQKDFALALALVVVLSLVRARRPRIGLRDRGVHASAHSAAASPRPRRPCDRTLGCGVAERRVAASTASHVSRRARRRRDACRSVHGAIATAGVGPHRGAPAADRGDRDGDREAAHRRRGQGVDHAVLFRCWLPRVPGVVRGPRGDTVATSMKRPTLRNGRRCSEFGRARRYELRARPSGSLAH